MPAKRRVSSRRQAAAADRPKSSPAARDIAAGVRRTRLVAFDFDGVFTDNTVLVSDEGAESVRCWRSDGLGLKELSRLGISTIIVSTETNPVVQHRSRKLAVRCFSGCEDKLAIVNQVATELSLGLDQVAFVGNDINDLACLSAVGLPIVVADAHPSVLGVAKYKTRARGGYGAVREVCDLFSETLGR